MDRVERSASAARQAAFLILEGGRVSIVELWARAHSGAYIVGDHHFWCMVIL